MRRVSEGSKKMTKDEFIKKAKKNNYTDEQINEMLDLQKEQKKQYGFEMPYDKIVLVPQPEYWCKQSGTLPGAFSTKESPYFRFLCFYVYISTWCI